MIDHTNYCRIQPYIQTFMSRGKSVRRTTRRRRTVRRRKQKGAGFLSALLSLGKVASRVAPKIARVAARTAPRIASTVRRTAPKFAKSLAKQAAQQALVEGISYGTDRLKRHIKKRSK